MGSRHDDGKRINVEGDRLGSLPDDLIHKILSFMEIKHAIKTIVLSSRWRYIWNSVPSLNFSNVGYHTLYEFHQFVTHVLSARNNQIEVFAVNLRLRRKVTLRIVKRILDYACSHNVQQLNITSLHTKKIDFPLSIFNSQSLKHLTLSGNDDELSITTPSTWEMPALTTLKLYRVKLNEEECSGLFSNCDNLKEFTLQRCTLKGFNCFKICHHGLSSLTLEIGCKAFNVDTPQLKNLTIKDWQGRCLISAPNLTSLHYKDRCYVVNGRGDRLQLLDSDQLYLEKVELCIHCFFLRTSYARQIVSLLQKLHAVKFLTLNLEFVKLLCSSPELISDQPSPFTNLKSLKVYPFYVNPEDQTPAQVSMSTEVEKFLLDGSPGATFTMISHEDIRCVMNVTSARNLIGKLHVLLDEWKESFETNDMTGGYMNQDMRAQAGGCFRERMACIERYWGNLSDECKKGHKYTRRSILMLRKIEETLTKLPPASSSRVKLEARFCGLHAQAETIMDSVVDSLKIQCDKINPSSQISSSSIN